MKKQDNVIIGIYKITNPKGKIYIGQSTNLKKREDSYEKLRCDKQYKLYNSLQKYGWEQHIFEIIEECTLEQLNEREIYWGLHYKVLEKKGLNLRLGNANGLCSKETKNKISKANKGKSKPKGFGVGRKCSEETKLKMRKPKPEDFSKRQIGKSKPNNPNLAKALKYKEKILELYKNKSILEISDLLDLDYGTIKSFLIKEGIYKKRKNFKKHPKSRIDKMKQIMINKLGTPIIQQDKKGNIIKEYPSQSEAFRQTGIRQTDISACCVGKQKTAGNYIWKFKN